MSKNNPTISSTSQNYLEIHDITNDIVLLKNGGASLIITVDALNFGLLAEEEQDAIIYTYASLLNSLNYSIQIIIKSKVKDATNYLHLLKDQEEKTQDKKKRKQIQEYQQFVNNLIQERNVLDKRFYVVVSASPLEMGVISTQSVVPGVKDPDINQFEKSVLLEKAKNNLEPKRDHLLGSFGRIGLYSRQLNTQEIIQLFYTSYNPEAAEGQQLTDSNNYTTQLVRASYQGENMINSSPSNNNQAPQVGGVPNSAPPQPNTTPPNNVGQVPTVPTNDVPTNTQPTSTNPTQPQANPTPIPTTTPSVESKPVATPPQPNNTPLVAGQTPTPITTPQKTVEPTMVENPVKKPPTPEEIVATNSSSAPMPKPTPPVSSPTEAQQTINSSVQEFATPSNTQPAATPVPENPSTSQPAQNTKPQLPEI